MTNDDEYAEFCERKLLRVPPAGLTEIPELHESLFDFQRDIVRWALIRGRCAIFASTGLGKTRQQVEWARHVPGPVLILSPLSVADQTVREGAAIGVDINHCRESSQVDLSRITITNYDRLHKFDTSAFGAVVLDESSVIKHHDAKTLQRMIDAFERTPYKLCCTATPSPNDYTELGTHAEFLGICSRVEMLSEFFCHDGGETQKWRLKKHARKAFWQWVSEWAALVRSPADLGYDGSLYELPKLDIIHHVSQSDSDAVRKQGMLIPMEAKTLTERRNARRGSIGDRSLECKRIVDESWKESGTKQPWLIWCNLNAEQDELEELFGDDAFSVRGADTIDSKEDSIAGWIAGDKPIMISKCSIMGFGLNLQFCNNMAFVGISDSWEEYHQAVRREWRFGQKKNVNVHIFTSDLEGAVVSNLKRKEDAAREMSNELSAETAEAVKAQIVSAKRQTNEYAPSVEMTLPSWILGV